MFFCPQFAKRAVQNHIAEGKLPGSELFPAPQHRADSCKQLIHIKWFGQIVIRAKVKSSDPVAHFLPRRQKKRRHSLSLHAQRFQYIHSVHPGHHNIEDQPVIGADPRVFICVLAVVHRVNAVSRVL